MIKKSANFSIEHCRCILEEAENHTSGRTQEIYKSNNLLDTRDI